MTATPKSSRRDFLQKLVSVAGGTAVLAGASSMVQASPQVIIDKPEKKTSPASSKGYQHTEHVDTYYKLADF